jgi:thiamine transport system permease protein
MTVLDVRTTPPTTSLVVGRPARRIPVSAIALTFLVAFLLVPLGAVVWHSFDSASLSLLMHWSTWRTVLLAAAQGLVSTALTFAIALPITGVLARYQVRGGGVVRALATIPFVLPTVVVALAVRQLLPAQWGEGFSAVVIAHALLNVAVVLWLVGTLWEQLDPRLEQVAASLGARPSTALRTITLPQLRPALLAAGALVFAYTTTSLGVVLFLGDQSTPTLELDIFRRTGVLVDLSGASVVALLQLCLVGSVLCIAAWLQSRTAHQVRRRTAAPSKKQAVGRQRIVVWTIVIVTLVIVVAPLAALAARSLRDGSHWTLNWWTGLGSIDRGTTRLGSPIDALAISGRTAILAAFMAVGVGASLAIGALRSRSGRVVAAAGLLPLAVSAATLGLGTLLVFGRPPLDLRSSGLIVSVAHALVAVPVVLGAMLPALRSVDTRLVLVAAGLGGRPLRAFVTAYGTVLVRAGAAAGALAFAISLGEFGAASFLGRAGTPTLPVQIGRLLGRPGEASIGTAAALAVLLALVTASVVLVVERLMRMRRA